MDVALTAAMLAAALGLVAGIATNQIRAVRHHRRSIR